MSAEKDDLTVDNVTIDNIDDFLPMPGAESIVNDFRVQMQINKKRSE